jgi:hypothetical protein
MSASKQKLRCQSCQARNRFVEKVRDVATGQFHIVCVDCRKVLDRLIREQMQRDIARAADEKADVEHFRKLEAEENAKL